MKILACDVGLSRVGLAVSDESATIAQPLTCVSRDDAYTRLQEIIDNEKIEKLVVGLPLLENGDEGSQAEDIKSFAIGLEKTIRLPIDFENEYLTSVEAERRLEGKRHQKEDIDIMAATVILENYLEKNKK